MICDISEVGVWWQTECHSDGCNNLLRHKVTHRGLKCYMLEIKSIFFKKQFKIMVKLKK